MAPCWRSPAEVCVSPLLPGEQHAPPVFFPQQTRCAIYHLGEGVGRASSVYFQATKPQRGHLGQVPPIDDKAEALLVVLPLFSGKFF